MRDDNELKASQKRHYPRDIVGNDSKKLLLYGIINKTTMIAALVVEWMLSKDRKV